MSTCTALWIRLTEFLLRLLTQCLNRSAKQILSTLIRFGLSFFSLCHGRGNSFVAGDAMIMTFSGTAQGSPVDKPCHRRAKRGANSHAKSLPEN